MATKIIDFHTHAFPDALARRAMKILLDEAPGIQAYLDGTLDALLASMQRNSIEKSVVCCIATRPEQFEPILNWCRTSRCEQFVMLPSIHPSASSCLDQIDQIKAEGFNGIKLHPFYQDFLIDEDRMLEIYDKLQRENLLAVMHTGFDIAFPRIRRADPEKIARINRLFPNLKLITTHLGAWQQWDEVERFIVGRPIYMGISFAMEYMEVSQAKRMITGHPSEYVLFGTDSPWTDQGQTTALLANLMLPEEKLNMILRSNAERLLSETGSAYR